MTPAAPVGRLGAALGVGVARLTEVGGGDIAHAYRVELVDGTTLFAKMLDRSGAMFPLEAAGLRWLAEAAAIRVPTVRYVAEDLLVLEYVPPGRPRGEASERALGEGLARLHLAGAPTFGRGSPTFGPGSPGSATTGNLATVELPDTPTDTWAEFYGSRRVVPLVAACRRGGVLGADAEAAARRLCERLPDLVGPDEPPARLHGDLWSGNVLWDVDGRPWLVDPAAYGGHREVDLAMLQLFGAPGPAFWQAYESVRPLAAGWRDRVSLYQILPLLVHALLFGGTYVSSAHRLLLRWSQSPPAA